MIFTSLTFLVFFIFLTILLKVFHGSDSRLNILLIASYIFYGWWNVTYLLLIFISSLWGWGLGLLMIKTTSITRKKAIVTLSLALSLGMLIFYKYADFMVNSLFYIFGIQRDSQFDILLPVGISFFTFQTMSYTIDLYRGNIEPCYSLRKFLLFVAFFPQLVAGPIVRASDFLPQLNRKIVFDKNDILIGAQIFLGGAIQKVLFADNLSMYVDPIFAEPELYSSATLWLGLLSYTMQIFCDFAGYSLMAIGIARMLGFKLPPNFNMPYLSQSVTELWTRWHISLSSWLRDYLYISLGGNRSGEFYTYRNLLITMVLGGLWHGASWNFVLWGAGHGLALGIHKIWGKHTEQFKVKSLAFYRLLAWSLTFLTVMMLWVPFRTTEFSDTLTFFKGLWSLQEGIFWANTKCCLLLGVASLWHIACQAQHKVLTCYPTLNFNSNRAIFGIVASLMLILLFAPQNATPFIYFQF